MERFNSRELRYAELKEDLRSISDTTEGLNQKLANLKDLKAKVDKVRQLLTQTLERTEIVKAIALQNKTLKAEYDRMAKKEAEYLRTIDRLHRQLEQREEEIRFLRERK